jgi:hypothetical protein
MHEVCWLSGLGRASDAVLGSAAAEAPSPVDMSHRKQNKTKQNKTPTETTASRVSAKVETAVGSTRNANFRPFLSSNPAVSRCFSGHAAQNPATTSSLNSLSISIDWNRYIVRILLLVPIYALCSFFETVFPGYAVRNITKLFAVEIVVVIFVVMFAVIFVVIFAVIFRRHFDDVIVRWC